MTKDEFLKRKEALRNRSAELFSRIDAHANEETRVIGVLHNSREILTCLNKTFEEKTSLSKVDISFLFLATGIQLIRIYFLSKFQSRFSDDDRLNHHDPEIKKWEKEEMEKYKQKHSHWKSKKSEKGYRSWQEIAFTLKVPYDATRHSGNGFNNRNMHGSQHRVKTLGHDPILGWIFGVANILTDSITICPEFKNGEKKLPLPFIESYSVDMGSDFCWRERISTLEVVSDSIESICEDKHRLFAALFSQGLHLSSDKFTKLGLPIPFLSLLNQDKAYEIYREGYDYLDYLYDTQILRRTMKSAAQSMLINTIIGGIHKLFYDPTKDFSHQLYDVRTRKIIMYSNLIATSSDIVKTAIGIYAEDQNALNDFDLGGFMITIYRLITDTIYIQKIKEEFIFKEWNRIVDSKDNILNI